MCGIVGYVGPREAAPILLEGLKRLEYRGYDSAGIATLSNGRFSVSRSPGKLSNLVEKLNGTSSAGTTGIGHTRWATHGRPTEVNAHPHTDCSGKIVVIHNGIFENFAERKAALAAAGHKFSSETDTEVFAHEVEAAFRGDLFAAVRHAAAKLTRRLRRRRLVERRAGGSRDRPLGAPDRARDRPGRELRRLRSGGSGVLDARRDLPRGRGRRARGREGRAHRGREGRDARARSSTGSSGTPSPRRRAATATSWPRRSTSSRPRSPRRSAARCRSAAGRSCSPIALLSPERVKDFDRVLLLACGTSWHSALDRQVPDRGDGADPRRGGLRQRVPLPPAGRGRPHADDRHLAVGRDGRHGRRALGSAPRGLADRGDRERAGEPDRPHGRRGLSDARGTRDRRGLDQGLHDPAGRALPDRGASCASRAGSERA